MPFISFAKKNRNRIEVPHGANLMHSLLQNGIPVASSCLGKGICSKCRLEITLGLESLPKETELETSLKIKNNIPSSCRISCQTQVTVDITVDASYW